MITPCGHRLIVKPYAQKDLDPLMSNALKSDALKGFEIVNTNEDRENASVDRGIVLAIGPTAWQNESHGYVPWCNVGDEILFAKFAGKFVKDPDTKLDVFILNDEDVVAVVAKGAINE